MPSCRAIVRRTANAEMIGRKRGAFRQNRRRGDEPSPQNSSTRGRYRFLIITARRKPSNERAARSSSCTLLLFPSLFYYECETHSGINESPWEENIYVTFEKHGVNREGDHTCKQLANHLLIVCLRCYRSSRANVPAYDKAVRHQPGDEALSCCTDDQQLRTAAFNKSPDTIDIQDVIP